MPMFRPRVLECQLPNRHHPLPSQFLHQDLRQSTPIPHRPALRRPDQLQSHLNQQHQPSRLRFHRLRRANYLRQAPPPNQRQPAREHRTANPGTSGLMVRVVIVMVPVVIVIVIVMVRVVIVMVRVVIVIVIVMVRVVIVMVPIGITVATENQAHVTTDKMIVGRTNELIHRRRDFAGRTERLRSSTLIMPALGAAKLTISASSTHIRPDRAQLTAGQVVEPDEPILRVQLAFHSEDRFCPCRVWRCRKTVRETTRTLFKLL